MPGRKPKRLRSASGSSVYRAAYGAPEEAYSPEDGYREAAYPEDGYREEPYPEDGYRGEAYPEDGYREAAYPEEEDPDEDSEEYPEDPEEKPEPRSLFRPDVRRPNFVLSVLVHTVRVLFLLAALAGVAVAGALLGIAKGYVDTAPKLDLVELESHAQTSFFMDCNGNEILQYKGTENRVVVSLGAIPTRLQNAFIAVEDARFRSHNGVDLKRIVGAFVNNLGSGGTQGGSTITQQLIKNTLLSPEQSYKRKIQEAYLAMQLEKDNDKNKILENYLNTIYLGENYYGVQVASQGYFGKELSQLTLRECAMLAGLTNNPYYYNPRRNFYRRTDGEKDYAAVTNDRTDYVLRCMVENEFITQEEYRQALDRTTATVLESSPSDGDSMYPYAHYVEYAVNEVVDILLEINGLENTAANRAQMEGKLRTGGYRIKLALDPTIQTTVQQTVQNWSKYPSLRDPSDKVFRSRNPDGTYTEIPEPQAACAVLDYRTGEIKAIIGGREEPTARKTLNRATDMKMPVGSSIKPIAVYAPALELGLSPASVAYNMPLPIPGWKDARGQDSWPTNYGGGGYVGPETLRTAMAKSHNTSTAYTLMTWVGVDRSVDFLHRMGIDDAHIDATPFGLSLGSSGITPLQMTVAFGVLANSGVYQEPISVLGISDSNGDVIWDGHQRQDRWRVFSDSTAYMIVDMLKDAVSSGTGTTAKIKGQTVAGKTGTNSDQKGVFFAGMTGYYSSALWVGHDNYKALSSKSTGSGAAAPLWQAYMSKLHTGLQNRAILDGNAADYNLIRVETCAVSGQLATDACRSDAKNRGTVTDYWAAGTAPTETCQMHVVGVVCAETGDPASEWCPNPVTRGVVTIPAGHPLARFVGTEYQSVLEEYLNYSTGSQDRICTLHSQFTQQDTDPWGTDPWGTDPWGADPWGTGPAGDGGTNPSLDGTGGSSEDTQAWIASAQIVLQQAYDSMTRMDPFTAQYSAVQSAVSRLEAAVGRSRPDASEIASCMDQLTNALNGIY